MPCDQIQTNTVDLPTMNDVLKERAIQAMQGVAIGQGYFLLNGNVYRVNAGELESRAGDVGQVADQLKRAYSAEVVKAVAKRNGWALRKTGEFQYEVSR